MALTATDFNFDKETVTINKSDQRLHGEDVITSPKTKKSNRTIKMPKFLCEEMQEYIGMLYGLKKKDRIFTVTKSYLHHEMDRGAKDAGVKRIRIHDDRVIIGASQKKPSKIKCLRLEGSNFRLGGIAPITRAVPSF